jgi:hypothetical protein
MSYRRCHVACSGGGWATCSHAKIRENLSEMSVCLSVYLSVCPTMFQVKCIAVYLFAQPVSKASPNNAGLEISNKDFCRGRGGGRREEGGGDRIKRW